MTLPNVTLNRHAVDEPAMVMGFISTKMHDQLRRLAAEKAVSESFLVSQFIRDALSNIDALHVHMQRVEHMLPREPE